MFKHIHTYARTHTHTYTHTHTHTHKNTLTGFRPPQNFRYILTEGIRYNFFWDVQAELLKSTVIDYMVTCDPGLEGIADRNGTSTGNFVILELGYGLSYSCRLSHNVRLSEAISLPNIITTVEHGMFELEPSTIL